MIDLSRKHICPVCKREFNWRATTGINPELMAKKRLNTTEEIKIEFSESYSNKIKVPYTTMRK
ncbi:hypothetical protein ACJDU8_24430 [Clostridium sp. WILCCON 0269]|uniref:Uncharacterized protein n=1 Tax=Candidatus Clostridium eludens TaxID=3381663 RepID=A0ABW8STY5_9CLOT